MKRCQHENADHLMLSDVFYPAYGTLGEFAVTCEQFRCLDCGAWLSLGESNHAYPVNAHSRS